MDVDKTNMETLDPEKSESHTEIIQIEEQKIKKEVKVVQLPVVKGNFEYLLSVVYFNLKE